MAKVAAEVTTANQYQILAKLASGGMAEIFLARGASVAGVERYCVLKRILRERARDAEFVQMFVHEARLVAQLQHPNIASVYDIGMLGDSYFFTMEYVHGETIRSLLHRAQTLQHPLPLGCVLTIIAGAAAGLHHAHERHSSDGRPLGIVHRDVSPSNLMVSYEGNVKVVDFGVAKTENHTIETRSGTVKGKITYLSPEQCRSARVDRRSDLFSLGIVLWEMLTGERLYRRDSDFDNMTAIVNEVAPPPSSRRADLPSAIDDLVARMLAKSPPDRFQTAAEVVDAIEAASLHAGTVLSTAAVSRLVRELFGVRAEPWLTLDDDAAPREPSTIESRPIPLDLERGPTHAVGARIVGALDPILSHLVAGRRAIAMSSALVVSPQVERVTEVGAPDEMPSPAPSAPGEDVASSVELEVRVPRSSDTGTRTTMFAPEGDPNPREQPAASSAALRVVTEPASASDPLDRTLAQDPAAIAPPGPHAAPDAPGAPAPRVVRRLAAVTAAALGAIVIWLAIRPAPDAPAARDTSRASASLPDAGARIFDATGAPVTAQRVDLAASHAVYPVYEVATAPAIDARVAPRARPTSAPPSRPTAAPPPPAIAARPPPAIASRPPPAIAAPPPPAIAAPPHRPAAIVVAAVSSPAVPPDAAPLDPPQPAPDSPGPGAPPSPESVSRLFRNGDYAMVVRICNAASLSRDIAGTCVMAACQEHDSAQAARWLPLGDPARRDQLIAFCKQHGGITLGNTLDCATNPLDCR